MDEKTRVARYEAQRGGGSETPRQRRRRLHKRGHQMRQATLRKLRPPVDLQLPGDGLRTRVMGAYSPLNGGLVFKPFKIPPGSDKS